MRKIYFLLIAVAFPLIATGNGENLNIFPAQQKSVTGRHSDQGLTVLAVDDQSGTMDDWSAYREFYPTRKGYRGIFTFYLPADRGPDISAMTLHTNFRGEAASSQLWRWQLWDFSINRWVTVGDNGMARSWEWSRLSFDVTGQLRRFVRRDGAILLRYITTANQGISNLDYLSLEIRSETEAASEWWRPSLESSWQIQLVSAPEGGRPDVTRDAEIYVIDIFNYDRDTAQSIVRQLHRMGRKVVCYFSAGTYEDWRSDASLYESHPRLLGKELKEWPGERWLDIRRIDILGPIISTRLDYLRDAGCDGVDPDNVDGYSNDHGFTNPPLRYEDQLRFNRWLAREAHRRGLGIGLKNNVGQIPELVSDFDWAINESCYKYSECDRLIPFVSQGKPVLHIEYEYPTEIFCPYTRALGLHSQRKERLLTAWREICP